MRIRILDSLTRRLPKRTGAARKRNTRRRRTITLLVLALPVAAVLLLGGSRGTWYIIPKLTDLEELPLAHYNRVLVLAPHCDDESLAAAGLMLSALRQGKEVRVVIATNGDGYLFATAQEFRRLYPRNRDFIHMGKIRQQESLSALKVLGVPMEDVTFLSYPDRGLPALWNQHWSSERPYRSPYHGTSRSPYPITYNPRSVFAGEDLLSDLRTILKEYKPDLIVCPDPEDMHPDHWALGVFSQLAVASIERGLPDYRPAVYAYLIHRPGFPSPKGYRPEDHLLPPGTLFDGSQRWYRLDVGWEDAAQKWEAIRSYHTQMPSLKGLLESFVRGNELFRALEPLDLPITTAGAPLAPERWRLPDGTPIGSVQEDSPRRFLAREIISAADLSAIYAAVTPDGELILSARLRSKAARSLVYVLRVTAIGEDGVVHHVASVAPFRRTNGGAKLSKEYIHCVVPMKELGDPWLVCVGAEVKTPTGVYLDQTAWQMLMVPSDQAPSRTDAP